MSCVGCDGHCENEGKLEVLLYIIALLIFISTFFLPVEPFIKVILYIATILLAGYEILFSGIKNIFKLNFEEDTLMTIAIIAACLLGEFVEGCAVVLLFKLGEFIEKKAVNKSNENIQKIVDIKAKNANRISSNGTIEIIDVNELEVGERILIKPGEMVPVDCKIISGESMLDTANITGESEPMTVHQNMEILSGCLNLNGSLTCTVSKKFAESTASQIVDLVYEAQNNKGKAEAFITKFSRIYTPTVMIIALLIVIIPLFLGEDFKTWIMRALVFLVAACPCSIVISIPLALYTCVGAISKKGMLIKGTKHIESLSKANVVAFDKTGTITTGKMQVDEIEILEGYSKSEIMQLLYALEKNSSHPIAGAINQKMLNDNQSIDTNLSVKNYEEIPGLGISGLIQNKRVIFGNEKLLAKEKIACNINNKRATYIAVDGEVVGYITLKEEVREDLDTLVHDLKKLGIKQTVMLTGDNEENARKIASKIGIDSYYAKLLPAQKLEEVQKLKQIGKVVFIGDGINDSPVLAAADFSISIGEGTEIANNTADGILISNHVGSIASMIKTAKQTMSVVKFNLTFSLLIKLVVLILGIFGIAPVWAAVFADVGVTILTVLNAIRIKCR